MDLIAALGATKSALDFLRTASTAVNDTKISLAMAQVTSKLMDAQAAALQSLQDNLAMTQSLRAAEQSITALERECEQLKMKADQFERYELHPVSEGVLVYRLKQAYAAAEPAHYCCPTCMTEGKRSILQARPAYGQLECHACKSEFWTADGGHAGLQYPSLGNF